MLNHSFLNFNKKIAVLVDANAFVHSTFHSYDPKLDIKGNDQKIIHGLLDTLVNLTYQIDKIDELFLIFDPDDGSLFRESQFPAYKKNRPPTPFELTTQRNSAKLLFKEKIGVPMVSFPGYEADDIMGSMAKIMEATGEYQIIIVSPDKDIAQLVSDDIFLLRKWRTKESRGYSLLNKERVKEDFGVHPEQIPDWLALMGDAADNLPGLYNVGKKTAADILSQYPSIEHLLSIVNHIENENLKNKVLEAKDTIPLVKKLAQIVIDLPIHQQMDDALDYSERIRTDPLYSENIMKLEKYFNWKPHYKELFL